MHLVLSVCLSHLTFSRYYHLYSNLTILTYYQYYMDTLMSHLKLITMLLECLLLFPLARLLCDCLFVCVLFV